MARARSGNTDLVSLFPFLNVLLCIMGVLALLISCMLLGESDQTAMDLRALSKLEAHENDLKARNDSLQAEIDRMANRDEEIVDLDKKVRELMDAKVEKLQKAHEKGEDPSVNPINQAAALREELQELQDRQRQIETTLRMSASADNGPIVVSGGGSGSNVYPFFVECTQDSLIVYRPVLGPSIVPRNQMSGSSLLTEFFGQARSAINGRVIFLIRPGGVPTYDEVFKIAEGRSIPNGKLPLPGDGPVEFEQ